MIHRPMGFAKLKPANFLKVAIATKKDTAKMTRQEMRRNCAGLACGRGQTKRWTHPEGEGSAVFGELEADEAVYKEARICSGD